MPISTAVDASAIARTVGIKTEFKDLSGTNVKYLPQRIAVIGQGNSANTYSVDKRTITSSAEAGNIYGFGSPLHLATQQLLPVNGDGVGVIPVTVYPLEDHASAVASSGSITPSGSATSNGSYRISINGILSEIFTIATGDTIAIIVTKMAEAVNAILEMPVLAVDGTTQLDLTSKWKGQSANDIILSIIENTSAGVNFTISDMTGGAANPDIESALSKIGSVWESFILNCLNYDDTVSLDKYQIFGEGRWGALQRKPLVVLTGTNEKILSNITSITNNRKTDRINGYITAPSSASLPFQIAGRALARISKIANNNPPHDYGSLKIDGIQAGEDADQWDYITRNLAVSSGISTSEVIDGVVSLGDIITFYRPEGEALPAYRHIVDIVKLQNIIFNINLEFNQPEWDGAPLLADNDLTRNPTAKKPKIAKAAALSIIKQLSLDAIIADIDYTKENIIFEISVQNPKRLDAVIPVRLSGNVNIISLDINFSFFFGSSQIIT